MPSDVAKAFEELNSILVLCPCCGEVYRLADARPYLKGRRPKTKFDSLEQSLQRVARAEERLDEKLQAMRERAREHGQRKAKRRLRKIDRVFSGAGLDPQDVKVIFDPVEYVVFDGLNGSRMRQVLLIGQEPESRETERVHASIEVAIRKGNAEFLTLRVNDDGKVEREP